MMRHDICLLLHLHTLAVRMPRPEDFVVILQNAHQYGEHRRKPIRNRTSVKLIGQSFPTMFPTFPARCLIFCSCSLDSRRFATTFASSSFFFATRSSAFSFA